VIVDLPLGVDDKTIPVLLCSGSSVDFPAELIIKDHVFVYQASPPTPAEIKRIAPILFEVERLGARRGSKHYYKKDGNEEKILEALMSCPNVKALFDKVMTNRTRLTFLFPSSNMLMECSLVSLRYDQIGTGIVKILT